MSWHDEIQVILSSDEGKVSWKVGSHINSSTLYPRSQSVAWSVQKMAKDAWIYERLEMYVTLAMSCFDDCFSFVIRVLPVEIPIPDTNT